MAIILPGSGQSYSNTLRNFSVAQLAPVAATRTLITGSQLLIPPRGMKVGDQYDVYFNMAKTAAGTATSTIDVATVARDAALSAANATARVSFTKPAGTAVADEGVVEISVTVRTVAAAGIMVGEFLLSHNLASTGHAQTPVVALYATSAGFDNTDLANGYIVTAITTGAADAVTIEVVRATYNQRGLAA